MALPNYNRPQISVPDQINHLKTDGLIFLDETRARHILENISLFRMKSYLNTIQADQFKQVQEECKF